MNIVIEYDPTVDQAPASYKVAVNAAVSYFESLIVSPITVSIMFSYGMLNGTALDSSALGESSSNGNIETYASIKSFLTAAQTSSADSQSIASLPGADPTTHGRFWVTDAQAKVFGLGSSSGYNNAVDGYVALGSGFNFTYDPANRAVSGAYDAIGVLEHEISEVLGRASYLGAPPLFESYNLYSPLDLFRYSSTGARVLTPAPGSFSVDGHTMLQAYNDPANGADAGDWNSSVSNDAFDAFTSAGTAQTISMADMLEMDVLGYQINLGATQGMTTQYVTSGVTSNGCALSGNQALSILNGGSANGTVVAGGHEFVFSGGVASGSVVDSGAFEVISSGGHASGETVNGGGELVVCAGGVVTSLALMDQALIDLSSISADSASVNGFDQLVATSGGVVVAAIGLTTADAGATFRVSSDGQGGALLTASVTNATGAVVSATAAGLSGQELDVLLSDAALTAVVVTDNNLVSASVAQLSRDAGVLNKLVFANSQITGTLQVTDTAANVAVALGGLNNNTQVGKIVISDNQPVSLTLAQLTSDSVALSELSNANGAPAALNLTGTSIDLSGGLPAGAASDVLNLVNPSATITLPPGITANIIGGGDTIIGAVGDTVVNFGAPNTFHGASYALVLAASNLNTVDQADSLSVSDAAGVTGGNIVLSGGDLRIADSAVGTLGIYDASGVAGGTVTLSANGLSLVDGGSALTIAAAAGVNSGALILAISNQNTIIDANGLSVSDAASVTGGNLVFGANNLTLSDGAVGGIGVYDASGVVGGLLTLAASDLTLIDGASALTIAAASGVSGGALILAISDQNTILDANGLRVSDAAGVTGGNIVLGMNNLILTDAAVGGIGVYDSDGIAGGIVTLAAGGMTLVDGANALTIAAALGVSGGALILAASNRNTIVDANGLTISDAAGVTGGNIVLGANNLTLTDVASGGIGVYDASGVAGGIVTLAAGGLTLVDGASALTIATASGVSSGALVLAINNQNTIIDANGLTISDAAGVTGGNLVLGANNLTLTDVASGGIGVYDASGVAGGVVTLAAGGLTLVDGASALTIAAASGVSSGALVLAINNQNTIVDATGLVVSDAAGVTGGNIVLGVSNLNLTDSAVGVIGVFDMGGVTGGRVTFGAGGLTLVDGASQLTLIGATQGGDVIVGASAALNGSTIENYAAKGDVVDLSDLAFSKITVATFSENAAGTAGTLNLSDGAHSASISLFGQFMAAGFNGSAASAGFVTSLYGAAGTKITYIAVPH